MKPNKMILILQTAYLLLLNLGLAIILIGALNTLLLRPEPRPGALIIMIIAYLFIILVSTIIIIFNTAHIFKRKARRW